MIVKRIITGELEENCYIIEQDNKCLVVDPGSDFDKIKDEIGTKEVLKVLITHCHFDHIGALEELKRHYNIEVIDYQTKEENIIVGPFSFIKRYNPGHTSDSISFYFQKENKIFVGDFIFKGSIGRCDLPTGNFKEMQESINKIKKLDKNLIIYPGHGDSTNLEYEIENNYYFK